MQNLFNNQSLVAVVWKWKVHLSVIGLLAVLLAALFSSPYFLTPLYRSTARLYPINTRSFSEESRSEQLLEIINSNDIKRQMISAFDLAARYRVDPEEPHFQTKVLREYDDHVSCKKTTYETVELTVLDADPQTACNMVDSLIAFYNRKMVAQNRQKYVERANSYARDLERKRSAIDSLSAQMETLRKTYGLLNYESQTQQLTLGYTDALARGASQRAINDIQQKLDNLAEKGGEFHRYEGEMRALESRRDTISSLLDKTLRLANLTESYTMVAEEPFPADKKAWPIRWVIVLISFMAAEFMAMFTILLLEGARTHQKQA